MNRGRPSLSPTLPRGAGGGYLCVQPLDALRGVLHSPVEVHRQHVLGPGLLPGVAVAQPVVRLLHLERGRQ